METAIDVYTNHIMTLRYILDVINALDADEIGYFDSHAENTTRVYQILTIAFDVLVSIHESQSE